MRQARSVNELNSQISTIRQPHSAKDRVEKNGYLEPYEWMRYIANSLPETAYMCVCACVPGCVIL